MIQPDVLFVKPGNQKKLYGDLSAFSLTAIEPPFWATMLASYIRNLGFYVELIDAEVEGWSYSETSKVIGEINPILCVISVSGSNPSASTMNMINASSLLDRLKKDFPNIKTLFHGLHPTSLPSQTMTDKNLDFLCQGEGFYSIPALIQAVKSGESNYDINGIWYRQGNDVKSNPCAPIFQNIDKLPIPAWDLLQINKYRAHNWHCFNNINDRQSYCVIYTSYGCPFSCEFCCINKMFGKPGIRYRNVELVIEEIDFLVTNYNIRNIKIADEIFGLSENRTVQLCDMIIEREYDLNMWAYARIDTVTPLMLEKMKKAGINWVAYGIESGNSKILNGVNKNYNLDIVENIVNLSKNAGLYIVGNYIFGLPKDDFDTLQDTLSLALKVNTEWSNFYCNMAYPGSKLYDDAVKNNLSLPETWQGFSQYSFESFPLPTKFLTSGEVLSFRDYAFHAYYENPRYLDNIEHLFGTETVHHIQEMTMYKLDRSFTQFHHSS